MQMIKVLSRKAHKMVTDPKFVARLKQSPTIVRSYDIPYVAGYSKDGKTVYVDRHYKKMMGNVNTEPFVVLHEMTEKALLDLYGLNYQQAHHIATHVERNKVRQAGISWDKYETFVENQYKHIGHEKLVSVPKDLDLEPYQDEHDGRELKQLKQLMKR